VDTAAFVPWLVVASFACGCGGVTKAGATSDASTDGTAAFDGSGVMDGSSIADAGADTNLGCGFSCQDAGSDGPRPPCPAQPPAASSPCSGPQVCEYGSSWWLSCNVTVQCLATSAGTWAWSVEFDGGQCTEAVDAGGPCPATYAEASSVDASPPTCPFVTCVYPEGFCGCGILCGGGGGLPKPLDVSGLFACIPARPGCPEPRPLSGTPCDSGASCDYGFGCGCGQGLQCVGGMWEAYREPPCP
jgi:hypothetical protein